MSDSDENDIQRYAAQTVLGMQLENVKNKKYFSMTTTFRQILGYLEKQRLHDTRLSFSSSSRHLTEEDKEVVKKSIGKTASIGLVQILSEHDKFKSRIEQFLNDCPLSPLITRIIDTEDAIKRLDIILSTLKSNLSLIDKVPDEETRKRKREDRSANFDVSQSNASTPEPKRRRNSQTASSMAASAAKDHTSKSKSRSKVGKTSSVHHAPSSSDSSGLETEDEVVETQCAASTAHIRTTPPPIIGEVT